MPLFSALSAKLHIDVCLRQMAALSGPGVQVDVEHGIIRNVAIVSPGPVVPARGPVCEIDQVFCQQVVDAINAAPQGVRSRLTHADLQGGPASDGVDTITCLVGRVRNARLIDGQVRADIHIGEYARSSPLGDMRSYLLGLAAEDPSAIGVSLFYRMAELVNRLGATPLARLKELKFVDFVGEPAANPAGLLSAGDPAAQPAQKQPEGAVPPAGRAGSTAPALLEGSAMNPQLREYLVSIGLPPEATEAEALEFMRQLPADQKARADELWVMDYSPPPTPVPATSETPPAAQSAPKPPNAANTTAGTPPGDSVEDRAARSAVAALQAENKRRSDIAALASAKGVDSAWAQRCMDENMTVAQVQKLVDLATSMRPVPGISVGQDRGQASLSDGIRDAVLLRAGRPVETPNDRSREFLGRSLLEIGRMFLSAWHVDTVGMSRLQVAGLLLSRNRLAQRIGTVAFTLATADFPLILADALGKTLRQGYELTPVTWSNWARRGTAPDFKQIKRLQLSEAPVLLAKAEGAEYKYGALGESREVYVLVTYGRGVMLTREMLINDDLDAFSRIVPSMGAQARRLEDDVCYAVLTANAAMSDSVALFHATHSNLQVAAAISVTSMGVVRAAMRKQTGIAVTDPSDGVSRSPILNLAVRHLIVPAALETLAEQFVSSVVDPAKTNATPNPFANKLAITAEPRLDTTSASVWYCAADSALIDTVEVCFLEGESEPVLEEEDDFNTDSRKYKVRHNVVAKAIDWRGLQRVGS
ncbi:MAG TPA: hypothetical protein VMW52_11090 [Phycisphaerae bacterium]|nr:hypothetical protein [Phycisphaerae bacterium]